jgi:hypothetical protein
MGELLILGMMLAFFFAYDWWAGKAKQKTTYVGTF